MVQALTLTYVLVQLVTLHFCKAICKSECVWDPTSSSPGIPTGLFLFYFRFPASGFTTRFQLRVLPPPPPHHMLSTAEILIQLRIDKPTSSQDLLHKTIQGKNTMLFCCPVIWVQHCSPAIGYRRICSCSIERRNSKREGKKGDIVRLGEEEGVGPI
jgi:hypothetical protein